MVVNRELIIFCLRSISEQYGFMKAETLIEALSAFQSEINFVEEVGNLKTYKVGNMAFRLYCNTDNIIMGVDLFEKDNNKVYYVGLSTLIFWNVTDCYPDCLKD